MVVINPDWTHDSAFVVYLYIFQAIYCIYIVLVSQDKYRSYLREITVQTAISYISCRLDGNLHSSERCSDSPAFYFHLKNVIISTSSFLQSFVNGLGNIKMPFVEYNSQDITTHIFQLFLHLFDSLPASFFSLHHQHYAINSSGNLNAIG